MGLVTEAPKTVKGCMTLYLFLILNVLNPKMAAAKPAIFSLQNNPTLLEDKDTLIFIHGSPGDHRTFKKYMKDERLSEKFNLIAIDRPGYGKSKRFHRQIGMAGQAKIIHNHLIKNTDLKNLETKKYIVSHSYGAPLSVLLAKELKNIDGLILMAGPYNPDFNMIKWYNHIGKWHLVKLFVGRFWTTSNQEMLPLNKDLKKVKTALANYDGETHFLHGNKDGIVPISHSKWAHEFRLQNNRLSHFVEHTSNHFFIWTKFRPIKDYILSLED